MLLEENLENFWKRPAVSFLNLMPLNENRKHRRRTENNMIFDSNIRENRKLHRPDSLRNPF